jgi:hypothetical protein
MRSRLHRMIWVMRMRHFLLARAIWVVVVAAPLFVHPSGSQAQDLAKRLILKDGSFQSVTKYELKGDRVRYLSAERGEWEELPKSLVDWPATEKYEKDRAAGAPTPEAIELDKEFEADKQAEEARSPHVLPGLQLPDEGGVFLLDSYENQPELVPIDQRSGSVNKNTKNNVLRAAINPVASAHQVVEVPGKHAPVQSHVTVPALYINIDRSEEGEDAVPETKPEGKSEGKKEETVSPTERFRIVRLEAKGDKRIVGDIKIAVYGKISQDAKFVPSTTQPMTGGWVKLTPTESLPAGEYAVVEMLGKEGMNLYVWDFGVNPNAPANTVAFRPDPSANQSRTTPIELQKRKKEK